MSVHTYTLYTAIFIYTKNMMSGSYCNSSVDDS